MQGRPNELVPLKKCKKSVAQGDLECYEKWIQDFGSS